MFAAPHLRQFVMERLTSAAEEIFVVFEKTIIEYEEQIEHQRRLLDMVYNPQVYLHRMEHQQQHACEDQEQQQVCVQRTTSSLDQEDPPSVYIKEEELCSSDEGEQLGLKQETDAFMVAAAHQESDHREGHIFNCSIEDVRSLVAKETQTISVSVQNSVVPEANSEQQLLSHNSDSGSTTAEPEHNSHTNPKHSETTSTIHSDAPTGKASFKCLKCEKVFKYRACLRKHMTKHPGEKTFTCKTCGNDFRRKSHLIGHMRIHTGERPFPCTICGKAFALDCDLKRHLRIHTGERPFTCTTCGKAFKRKSHLREHMRTHTGEKFPHWFLSQSPPHMYEDVYLGTYLEEFS